MTAYRTNIPPSAFCLRILDQLPTRWRLRGYRILIIVIVATAVWDPAPLAATAATLALFLQPSRPARREQ